MYDFMACVLTKLVSDASVLTQVFQTFALMDSSLSFLDDSSSVELLSELPLFPRMLVLLLLLLSDFLFLDGLSSFSAGFLFIYSLSWFFRVL